MSCTGSFLLRAAFLSFLALNAWNSLQNFEAHHKEFVSNHNAFKQNLQARTGLQVPVEAAALINLHSENIVKYILWGTLGLSAAALVLSKCLTWTVGFVFLLRQLLALNVVAFTCSTPLAEWERLAFAVSIFVGSIALSCGNKGGKCGKKASNAQDTKNNTQKQNAQRGKKNKNRRRD